MFSRFQPASLANGSSNGTCHDREGSPNGEAGQMNTSPRTRSGCSEANRIIGPDDPENPTSTAARTPDASMTASRFAARARVVLDDRVGRSVRETIAAVVPGDHEVTASELRKLRLPDASVDDLPWRYEHERRIARTVHLVCDLATIALHDARDIRVAGTHLLWRTARTVDVRRSGRRRGRRHDVLAVVRSSPVRRRDGAAGRPFAGRIASATSIR